MLMLNQVFCALLSHNMRVRGELLAKVLSLPSKLEWPGSLLGGSSERFSEKYRRS